MNELITLVCIIAVCYMASQILLALMLVVACKRGKQTILEQWLNHEDEDLITKVVDLCLLILSMPAIVIAILFGYDREIKEDSK